MRNPPLFTILTTRMRFRIYFTDPVLIDLCINLRSGNIRMA